jgi:hypothetical protein
MPFPFRRLQRQPDGTDVVETVQVEIGDPIPGFDQANFDALFDAAVKALKNNREFLLLDTPTNAQAVAQIRALTRQMSAIIRLQNSWFDSM